MNVLADENIPFKSIHLLVINGIDIKSIGKDNPSVSDEEVINIANIENRTIITFDSDFGKLIFLHNLIVGAGVIYFRIVDFTPEEPARILLDLFEYHKLKYKRRLTVIEQNKIRQRKY